MRNGKALIAGIFLCVSCIDAGENVGTYAITQGTLALADNAPFLAANYTLSFTAGETFAITAKTITVTIMIACKRGTSRRSIAKIIRRPNPG